MLMVKRAAPWHTYPLNWIIGKSIVHVPVVTLSETQLLVFFGNLTGSLFFAGVLTKGTSSTLKS